MREQIQNPAKNSAYGTKSSMRGALCELFITLP